MPLLIRENFGVPVRRGYLVYTRSQNRVVPIDYQPDDFRRVGRIVREILDVLYSGTLPAPGPGLPLRRLLLPIYLRLSSPMPQSFADRIVCVVIPMQGQQYAAHSAPGSPHPAIYLPEYLLRKPQISMV